MATQTLKIEKRGKQGRRESRRHRQQGKIPAVMYGMGEAPESILVNEVEVQGALRHHARVFELSEGSKKVHVLLKEIQLDPLGENILHLDFYRVKVGQKVEVKVALEFVGHPKGVTAGGEFVHVISDLAVECDVDKIPASIPVSVKELELNHSLRVSDIQFPVGVSSTLPPETIICSITSKAAEPEPTAAVAGEEGSAEPEVITKGKAEEGEEGAEAAKPEKSKSEK